MPDPLSLDNVSIVLVHTKTPANIGAVARSMMNMGLSRLVLVRPPRDPRGEALKLAAGAEGIVRSAPVFATLEEAIADQQLVIGASRHRTRRRLNVSTPREAARELVPQLASNRAAIVFGREVNGLEKSDIALCQELIAIPSSGAFPSLNLSHAVMVVAYELFIASADSAAAPGRDLADAGEMERFYGHLERTLGSIGFLEPERPERIMYALRQLFGRARPDRRDLGILRGILTGIDRKDGKADR
jgi:TrmH family RNA methyltransferase